MCYLLVDLMYYFAADLMCYFAADLLFAVDGNDDYV